MKIVSVKTKSVSKAKKYAPWAKKFEVNHKTGYTTCFETVELWENYIKSKHPQPEPEETCMVAGE